MISKLKNFVKNLYYRKGFKTNEKIIVFESDDWGCLRSSKEGIKYLKENRPEFELNSYQAVDCLESEKDLTKLANVLKKYKDINNNYPVFTLNFVMQNVAIKDDDSLVYEDFDKTYERYNYKSLDYLKNLKERVFYPQLHGLLHFNLQKHIDAFEDEVIKNCFKLETVGLLGGQYCGCDAFDVSGKSNENKLDEDIRQACKIFAEKFGYNSDTFVFPCYVWNNHFEKELKKYGVKNIQASMFQNVPLEDENRKNCYKKVLHYMGEKNKIGGVYTVRNCYFEPINYDDKEKCKVDCLNQIEKAFKYNKPAIICSHRANYVSGISLKNRDENLLLLDELLSEIAKTHPDVQFMTSSELAEKNK